MPVSRWSALRRAVWLFVIMSTWLGAGEPASAERPAPDRQAGEAVYQQSCARCHGVAGKGDGVDARRFYPRPRDLTMGVYKFRSTASGTPPTDEDLFDTITRGLPGSNMPDWRHLDEAARWHVVDYLKSLAPIFEQTPPEPVPVSDDPGPTHADLAKGRAVYEQLGCAACHGAQGRANGSSAAGLVDDWGKPIRPADLTQPWTYRGGRTPRDIMLRLLTGIDGAGMPSYTGAVSPEDAWQVAYYVASLQAEPVWHRLPAAARVTGELPMAPDDPRWHGAEPAMLRLRNAVNAQGEWVAPPTITAVEVQALLNDDAVAFRVRWHDPSEDAAAPGDALALLFKTEESTGDLVSLQAWPYHGAPSLDLCYWVVGEPAAREAVAATYDAVRAGSSLAVARPARAAYAEGAWQLVLQRPRRPDPALPGAARVPEHGAFALAVVIWDGGNPEARAISPWIDLLIEDTAAPRATAH